MIQESDLRDIFGILSLSDIIIHDLQIYQLAFHIKKTNPSSPKERDNERDEFLGDSLIGCITALYLYERFEDENEGFLTKLKTKLVNGKMLAYLASKLNFEKYLTIPSCHRQKTIDAMMEDCLEAFVSALYHDQKLYAETHQLEKPSAFALDKIQTFFIRLIETFVDFSSLIMNEDNYKDLLLKYFHKKYKSSPTYKDIMIEGPPHHRIFTVSVLHVNGEELGRGCGDTKREAEQQAAKHALQLLNL